MTGRAPVAAAALLGAVLAVPPAVATPVPAPVGEQASEQAALRLLAASVRAAEGLRYRGTQYVASWHGGRSSSSLVEVSHDPALGWRSATAAGARVGDAAPAGPALDARRLRLLAAHYALEPAGRATCAGRVAEVVDVRRPGVAGAGQLAGRFWVDRGTGLVLRRDLYDRAGRAVQSSAFVDVTVQGRVAATAAVALAGAAVPLPVPVSAPAFAPRALPHDLELFDVVERRHGSARVAHLAYSDGLSSVSVFAQRGRADAASLRGFSQHRVGPAVAWVADGSPTRVVWNGGGRVWTLVADAPSDVVRDVVLALPHDGEARQGVLSRLGERLRRGLARVGSWLNPFS